MELLMVCAVWALFRLSAASKLSARSASPRVTAAMRSSPRSARSATPCIRVSSEFSRRSADSSRSTSKVSARERCSTMPICCAMTLTSRPLFSAPSMRSAREAMASLRFSERSNRSASASSALPSGVSSWLIPVGSPALGFCTCSLRGPLPSSSLATWVSALVTHSPIVSRRREAALPALARASRDTPRTDHGEGGLAFCLTAAAPAARPLSGLLSAIVRPH